MIKMFPQFFSVKSRKQEPLFSKIVYEELQPEEFSDNFQKENGKHKLPSRWFS